MGADRRRASSFVSLLLAALALAACSSGEREPEPETRATPTTAAATGAPAATTRTQGAARTARPLRGGERRLTLEMPEAYRPQPPTSAATDDYRCFLLDPGLADDVFVTGTDVRPGNPRVVHHVILSRVPPEQVAEAEGLDDDTDGQGWTCFGDTGLETGSDLNDAPWLGAWAPGGAESVLRRGYGAPLARGSRIVMQVHYNLRVGDGLDVSATQLRVAPSAADLTPVTTMLLPAPVELPCRANRRDNPLCDRDAALSDLRERVGYAGTADWLHVLCGTPVRPSRVTQCERRIDRATTVVGVAGHMHLLGKEISIEVDPGRPGARTLLDLPVWNFDDQRARPVRPFELEAGDRVRVTCRHDQSIRDDLPAFDGQPDRYVVWGEGTSDEMCLGILLVARS